MKYPQNTMEFIGSFHTEEQCLLYLEGIRWENFCAIERKKILEYTRDSANAYFWRTYSWQKVDYVEEKDGNLFGFEFKWTKASKIPENWQKTYPTASYTVINRENYLDFVCGTG